MTPEPLEKAIEGKQFEVARNQKIFLNERLLESGVDINQVNAVRRLFSRLKGGRLAQRAQPAGITQIIFSDVMDNNLETIASGIAAPTSY